MFMFKKKLPLFAFLFAPILALSLVSATYAIEKDKPFTTTVLNLSSFKGKTFYEFMEAKDGLHQALNADLEEPIKLIDLKRMKEIIKTEFDPSIFKRMTSMLRNEAGFDKLFTKLEQEIKSGKKLTMNNIAEELRSIMGSEHLLKDSSKIGLAPLIVAPVFAMASGAGTTVVLDDGNFFLNYNYKLGPDDEGADAAIKWIQKKEGVSEYEAKKLLEAAALKSGRNFGYSGSEKLLDFSDTYLLRKFDTWVDNATPQEAEKLWTVVFDILTKSETSGMKTLSVESQSVVTGWLTVYTAELRRHTMVRMNPGAHPWENDLTEALFSSVFVKKNGGFMFGDKTVRSKHPEIVKGKPENFFGIGTQGSGIGVNRMERRGLQTLMTEALEESNPEEVAEIRKLTDRKYGDLFRGVMEFINNPENQSLVKERGDRLSRAFGKVMAVLHTEEGSKKTLAYFTEKGDVTPILKKKFIPVICKTYFKP